MKSCYLCTLTVLHILYVTHIFYVVGVVLCFLNFNLEKCCQPCHLHKVPALEITYKSFRSCAWHVGTEKYLYNKSFLGMRLFHFFGLF